MTLPNRIQGNLCANVCSDSIALLRDRIQGLYEFSQTPHVTLLFGAVQAEYLSYIGQYFNVFVVSHCWNDRIQVLRVDLPVELERLCQNRVPHITLSWVDGARPYEAKADQHPNIATRRREILEALGSN